MTTVIVVLAIIGGAAYAGFEGALGERASGTAEAVMNNVVVAEQQLFSDYGSYTAWPQDLQIAGVGATLLSGDPSTGPLEVSMVVGDRGTLGLAARVSEDECRVLRVAPMSVGGGQVLVPVDGGAPCAGDLALPGSEEPAEQVAAVRTGS